MRNKESKKWVLTDRRHEYCIKLLIGSNKEAEKGTWETKYLDRTQDYRFYSTEVQITQPYKMITNLRLDHFIAELGELKQHRCCSIFVNLFAIFDHTWYLSRTPRIYSCKFFLAGVNFYRFNAKNWQFTVYFAVITQKIGNFLCILS